NALCDCWVYDTDTRVWEQHQKWEGTPTGITNDGTRHTVSGDKAHVFMNTSEIPRRPLYGQYTLEGGLQWLSNPLRRMPDSVQVLGRLLVCHSRGYITYDTVTGLWGRAMKGTVRFKPAVTSTGVPGETLLFHCAPEDGGVTIQWTSTEWNADYVYPDIGMKWAEDTFRQRNMMGST
ncbi:hypothetical protein KIPB_011497, partial [Kipferlia bialata]